MSVLPYRALPCRAVLLQLLHAESEGAELDAAQAAEDARVGCPLRWAMRGDEHRHRRRRNGAVWHSLSACPWWPDDARGWVELVGGPWSGLACRWCAGLRQ